LPEQPDVLVGLLGADGADLVVRVEDFDGLVQVAEDLLLFLDLAAKLVNLARDPCPAIPQGRHGVHVAVLVHAPKYGARADSVLVANAP
jgi:hypothetical protein